MDTLDAMADFSIEAKSRGYVVSMAPAESYLDPTIEVGGSSADESAFSLDLALPPRSWTFDRYGATDDDRYRVRDAGFSHAGRQCYARVLSKAGIETFDWVSLQLYEAYSPFAHDLHSKQMDQVEALMMRVRGLVDGFVVTGLPPSSSAAGGATTEYEVRVPPSKIVLGIANGWVDGVKFCRVDPRSVRKAYESTHAEYGRGFLGVMFWTIEEEGGGRKGEGGDDDVDDDDRLAHMLSREFKDLGGGQSSSSEL